MKDIEALTLLAVLDGPRRRARCEECEKRRLTTLCYFRNRRGHLIALRFCNECLTRTPPWSRQRAAS